MTNYATIRYQPAAATTTIVADMTALFAVTGMSNGDQVLVLSNNNLFMYSGTGWYKIATLQNDSPTAITGVNGTYALATDGTPTIITAASTDPEGFPLTWTYSTSGLGSIATISQSDNVFTITPSTNSADLGTFTLTINVTDGANGAVSTNTSISLEFEIVNSNYTTLLATAVDTSTNNVITDSSSNNHGLTGTNPYAGTFSPYRHGGYSVYFDGTGDSLTTTSTDYNLGTSSAFTVEFWYYFDESRTHTVFDFYNSSAGQAAKLAFTSTNVYLYDGTANILALTRTQNVGVWEHFCWTRDASNNHTFYINGSQVGTSTATTSIDAYTIDLGRRAGSFNSTFMKGYISDFRLVKGTAITPPESGGPTERLTAVTNTQLLTCHLPYIADGSINNHSITVNGNTSTKPIGPYDYNEYSENTNGGSVYFDGDADHLEGPSVDIMGNGAFTVECWVYILSNTTGTTDAFLAQYQTNLKFIIGVKADVVRVWMSGLEVRVGTTNIINNGWHHIALVRDSSNSCQLYVDGVAEGAAFTNSTDFSTSLENFEIGSWNAGGTSDLHGYISDLRVVKGTAVYTSAFTPPITRLSTISGTTLHVKGTDASIIDKAQTSNLNLVGNTTGSTTQVKFTGSKSMYFDGVSDYIITTQQELGTEDFTIEGWHYLLSRSNNRNGIFGNYSSYTAGSLGMFAGHSSGSSTSYQVAYNGAAFPASVIQGGTIVYNQWVHFAVVRNSGIMNLYIDGTSVDSISATASLNGVGSNFIVGAPGDNLTDGMQGYLQDFRITKGLARYTANFTPPAEPLKG